MFLIFKKKIIMISGGAFMTISRSIEFRPKRFGEGNRKNLSTSEGEVALQIENDANGNPIYIGKAIVGSVTSAERWQIAFLQYDINNALISKEWPQNSEGRASSNYEFVWDNRATYTFS